MIEPGLTLAILVHDLSATGVVRNAIRVAGHMAGRGHRTELWVIRDSGAFRDQVPAAVAIRTIGSGRQMPVRRIETLLAVNSIAGAIGRHRPAALLSAGNHFHLAAGLAYAKAGRPPHTRFMGRASNATPRISRNLPVIAWFANAVDGLKYREMHKVIAVSQELAADLHTRLRIPQPRIAVIPNGVDLEAISRLAAEPLGDPWFAPGEPSIIISAGRLAKQKNYPLLLKAFAILRQQRPARLVILGEGSATSRARLLHLARSLQVEADVRFQGFEANPMRFFARSGLFVLSSLWEGASNVLLEAMACGCPVVATGCPTGVREQLDNGRIGPIVPVNDAVALAQAMTRRLDAPRDGGTLKYYVSRFGHARMLSSYECLVAGAPDVGR